MSTDWTPEELEAASRVMKRHGFLSLPEFKVELGLGMLEDIMKEHGCSKAKLAEALGTSRQNVSQVFKGGQYFTVKQIRTMAEMFSMDPIQVCECFALTDIPPEWADAVSRYEAVIDTLIEVGNGTTYEDLHKAADELMAIRDILF